MIKQVLSLLSREEKRLSIRVVATVFLRALLDFAGVAALIPILIMVMGDSPDRWKILFLCCGVLLFVLCKNGLAYLLTRYQSQYLLNINKRLSQAMFSRYYERGLLFLKSKSTVQLGYEVNFICMFTHMACNLAAFNCRFGQIYKDRCCIPCIINCRWCRCSADFRIFV